METECQSVVPDEKLTSYVTLTSDAISEIGKKEIAFILLLWYAIDCACAA